MLPEILIQVDEILLQVDEIMTCENISANLYMKLYTSLYKHKFSPNKEIYNLILINTKEKMRDKVYILHRDKYIKNMKILLRMYSLVSIMDIDFLPLADKLYDSTIIKTFLFTIRSNYNNFYEHKDMLQLIIEKYHLQFIEK